jgi:hypothetical protein
VNFCIVAAQIDQAKSIPSSRSLGTATDHRFASAELLRALVFLMQGTERSLC